MRVMLEPKVFYGLREFYNLSVAGEKSDFSFHLVKHDNLTCLLQTRRSFAMDTGAYSASSITTGETSKLISQKKHSPKYH